MRRGGSLVFVGDAHLERDDPMLDRFLAFLDALGRTAGRIVFMGDLFNLWIGRRELEQPHQAAVVERLERLRRNGVVLRYLEGNRDYRIGLGYTGSALDDAGDAGIVERFAGRSLFAIHGDLANPSDHRYRAWRRLSRSRPVWGLYNLLPRRRRLAWAEAVERRLRASNRAFKGAFPERIVRDYAAGFLAAGHDAVVLGHFHVERDLETPQGGRVLVVPEWKSTRRYLRVDPDGAIEFVGWDG